MWVHDRWLNGGYEAEPLVKALAAVIREEIAEEREACAKLAEDFASYMGQAYGPVCPEIAAAIRARE